VHSSARELVAQGKEAEAGRQDTGDQPVESLLPAPAARRPCGSFARSGDRPGLRRKPAYGYRRVVWWLGPHHPLVVNGKRALCVMRECGLVRQRRFQVSRRKDGGKVEAASTAPLQRIRRLSFIRIARSSSR
jgi:hypothetical protein